MTGKAQLSGYRLTNEIQSMPVAEISLHWHPDQLRGPLPFWGKLRLGMCGTLPPLLHTSLSCIMINHMASFTLVSLKGQGRKPWWYRAALKGITPQQTRNKSVIHPTVSHFSYL